MTQASPKITIERLLARAHWVGLILYAQAPRIFMYHSIVRNGSPYAQLVPGKFVEETVFDQCMAYVSRYCRPLSLVELVLHIVRGSEFPRNAVVVTFDDGYANNWFRAASILTKYRIPATFFVTTGFIDKVVPLWTSTLDRYFVERHCVPEMDRFVGLPTQWTTSTGGNVLRTYNKVLKEMAPSPRQKILETLAIQSPYDEDAKDALEPLTWEQLRMLSKIAGMTVAPHTVSHPILAQLSEEHVEDEIAESFRRLQEQGVQPAYSFAYPYGTAETYTARHVELLKKLSFRCAVTAHPGLVRRKVSLFSLPRFGGKNDVNKFICHASGLQCLLSSAKRVARLGKTTGSSRRRSYASDGIEA